MNGEAMTELEVIGHDEVRARFLRALDSGRLHHAWLLHGPAGIGKARLAAALAAAALCENPRADGACGACHACRMFRVGAHPDALFVAREEGKRDLRIEQVREALSFLALSSGAGARRVVVLDDAGFMNLQAANALLKGLEEPASGSLLLLVCDDPERLPATVRSRCLLQACAPLDDAGVRAVLARLGLPEAHMDFAARLAEGAPGAVAALADAALADAAAELDALCADPGRADVAALEAWANAHANAMPAPLIARIAARAALRALDDGALSGAKRLRALDAIGEMLAWPGALRRHALRPAPSLLAALLGVRAALRE